jgi:hypothetical protein
MPTILFIDGWRFFFYSNESEEPIHIHVQKGEKECKYWLKRKEFDIIEAYSYNMYHKDIRKVKRIIFEYFELIEKEWDKFQKRK